MVQFRSETMLHGTLIIPADRAHEVMDVLGRETSLQIVDMNAHSGQRQYKKYIQRIDEMERKLRFLFEEIAKLPGAQIIKNQVDSFLDSSDKYKLDKVEGSLGKVYDEFVKFRENNSVLKAERVAAVEEYAVATAATHSLGPEFGATVPSRATDVSNVNLLESRDVEQGSSEFDGVTFSNFSGTLDPKDQERFARTIFRATRGNAYTHFETVTDQFEEPNAKDETASVMTVFVIYYQGNSQSAVAQRILRICSAFGVRRYTWPRSFNEAETRLHELAAVIEDKSRALQGYEQYFIGEMRILLDEVRPGGNSVIEEWRLFCIKERSVYATLNLFEGSDTTLRADCWYPAMTDGAIRRVLMGQSNLKQVSAFLFADHRPIQKSNPPPTYFRCPEFTAGFQDFVNTYGVPRYKEANPALTTIITLPFLFGIMYGDVGHGSIILMVGLYMVTAWHSKLKYNSSELLQLVGGGRYMIMLMGIFATYSGFLYNDFFALGMDIFGTRYVEQSAAGDTILLQRDLSKGVYPFGFDPAWKGATNEIDFFNSFKMKFAVIVGFLQMGAGVLHKGANAIYFRDRLTLLFEFLPQLIFLSSLVGYMDTLIVYKWLTPVTYPKPNIITTIINMFFFQADEPFWSSQRGIQILLVLIMLVCIPWMLFPKPLLAKRQHEKRVAARLAAAEIAEPAEEITVLKPAGAGNGGSTVFDGYSSVTGDTASGGPLNRPSFAGSTFGLALTPVDTTSNMVAEDEDYNFTEEFIHQMIESIEFILAAISNTASYLRLWALSLAHQQLALVFFENTIMRVLSISGLNTVVLGVMTFIAFGAFAAVTAGVMLGMDSLECFLHALRLQWVEFQNKFYKADGHKFEPFNFRTALTETT